MVIICGVLRLTWAQEKQNKDVQMLTGHSNRVYSVAFSPDGKTLASASLRLPFCAFSSVQPPQGDVKLWDTQTGVLQRTLTGFKGNGVSSVAFSPDGKVVAGGSDDQTIRLWDVQTGALRRTLTGHSRGVVCVAFSPGGKTLASGGWDNTVRLWNVQTGSFTRTLTWHKNNRVTSVAFSPDGKTLAIGWEEWTENVFGVLHLTSGKVELWDTQTGILKRTLTGHSDSVLSVAFSPDGRTLASGSADRTAKLWNVETGELEQTLKGYRSSVDAVAFSPDSRIVATDDVEMVKLWDAQTGELKRTLTQHESSITRLPSLLMARFWRPGHWMAK